MRFLRRFTHSHDPRWPSPLHSGPFLYLPIALAVILIVIFSIAQLIWAGVFADKYGSGSYGDAVPEFSFGYSDTSSRAAEAIAVFLAVPLVEIVHLPAMMYFYARPSMHQASPSAPPTPRHRLHPIAPLVLSFCLAAVWGWQLTFRLIVDLSSERETLPGWRVLTYLMLALMGCVICAYLAMFGISCAAVHRWRLGRKNVMMRDGGDVELQKL